METIGKDWTTAHQGMDAKTGSRDLRPRPAENLGYLHHPSGTLSKLPINPDKSPIRPDLAQNEIMSMPNDKKEKAF